MGSRLCYEQMARVAGAAFVLRKNAGHERYEKMAGKSELMRPIASACVQKRVPVSKSEHPYSECERRELPKTRNLVL